MDYPDLASPIAKISILQMQTLFDIQFAGPSKKIRRLDLFAYDNFQSKLTQYIAFIPKESGTFFFQEADRKQQAFSAFYQGTLEHGQITCDLVNLQGIERFYLLLKMHDHDSFSTPWITISPLSYEKKQEIKKQVAVVIPCYNAEKFVEDVVIKTLEFTDRLILVNDGSTDNSPQILENLSKSYPDKIALVSLEKNSGKGTALLNGFKKALEFPFSGLVTIDADAQHNPSDIPFLAKEILQNFELVIGERLFRLMPLRSKISNAIISFFLRRFYAKAPKDTQSGMRGFSRGMIKQIVQEIHGGCYEVEFCILLLALKQKLKIKSVPITTIYIEKNRSSHFSPFKDSLKIIRVLVSHLIKNGVQKFKS